MGIIRNKKNRLIKIILRTSSISSVLTFVLGLVGVSLTVVIPTAIVLGLIAFGCSIIVEFTPDSIEKIKKLVSKIDVDNLSDREILELYNLQSGVKSVCTRSQASIKTQNGSVRQPTN